MYCSRSRRLQAIHLNVPRGHPGTPEHIEIPRTLSSNYSAIMNRKASRQGTCLSSLNVVQHWLQEKPQFWKRKPSIVKCHMLILAHLARAEIPKTLRGDYSAIMKKCPLFLEEMINIANLPRPPAVRACLC